MKTKTILITGAGGFLGQNLIKALLNKESYNVWALTSQKNILQNQFKNLKIFDANQWEQDIDFSKIDVLIHCAFARANKRGKAIAEAVVFSQKTFEKAIKQGCKAIINISTQEVYGNTPLLRTENLEVAPNSIYGMAKYTTELFLIEASKNTKTPITNIRLSGLIGVGANQRAISQFIDNIIKQKPISIVKGEVLLSQIDIRDVVAGLQALLKTDTNKWKVIYNLGYLKPYLLSEIAKLVVKIGKSLGFNGFILHNEIEEHLNVNLDSSLFYQDTNWKPVCAIENTIEAIFKDKLKEIKE